MSAVAPMPESVTEISDAALMRRLASGRVEALGLLHQRYARMVRSLMLRLVPSLTVQEAEDLCQEVFLTLLETAKRYKEQGRFRSWLCGIAVRKARGWQRRTWFRRRSLLNSGRAHPARALPTAGDESDRLAARQEVVEALAGLPHGYREVVVLSSVEGLPAQAIAEILGIKPGTVWVRLHRARKAMRERLGQEGGQT